MHEWNDLFVATSGAAAALTGLIFVGISINLEKILKTSQLPNRALLSLILLLTILVISLLLLIPNQSLHFIGIEILSISFIVWIVSSLLDVSILKATDKIYKKRYAVYIFFNQLAILMYVTGGILILSHREPGMLCIVTAIILSFINSVLDAWVLLIEINR